MIEKRYKILCFINIVSLCLFLPLCSVFLGWIASLSLVIMNFHGCSTTHCVSIDQIYFFDTHRQKKTVFSLRCVLFLLIFINFHVWYTLPIFACFQLLEFSPPKTGVDANNLWLPKRLLEMQTLVFGWKNSSNILVVSFRLCTSIPWDGVDASTGSSRKKESGLEESATRRRWKARKNLIKMFCAYIN